MKPIIAFDMGGTLLSASASEAAHKKWFAIMADLLGDSSVNEIASKKDYFPDLLSVMSRLTGLRVEDGFDKTTMISYARNLFQMLYLAELRKQGKNPLVLDSKAPTMKFSEHAIKENRFRVLTKSKPENAKRLMEIADSMVAAKFDFLQKLAAMPPYVSDSDEGSK